MSNPFEHPTSFRGNGNAEGTLGVSHRSAERRIYCTRSSAYTCVCVRSCVCVCAFAVSARVESVGNGG